MKNLALDKSKSRHTHTESEREGERERRTTRWQSAVATLSTRMKFHPFNIPTFYACTKAHEICILVCRYSDPLAYS
jgi:hypothetical protein